MMRQFLGRSASWGLVLLLGGCAVEPIGQLLPTESVLPMTATPAPVVQRFKLTLTLSAPQDLKVQQGDRVQAGQVLADRVRDRVRLEFQRRELQQRMTQVKAQLAQPVPGVAGLPPASFLSEVAEVERLQVKALAVQRNKEQQQRKFDLLSTLPQSEVPEAVMPHETEVLKQKEREVDQAQAEVDLARGKLAKAQNERQFQEYAYSLELSKRAIALRQQEIEQQNQLALLAVKLSELEIQLSTLSAIRSPYSGTIQRIKFVGQNDQALTVELVLVVSDRQLRGGTGQESGGGSQESGG